MNIDELPKGWIRCSLIDCGEITSGGTPSTKIAANWGDEVSWITPADLSGYENKHIAKGKKSITQKGLLRSSAKLMPAGSVLFSTRAPIGYVAIATNELCTNQGFKSITPDGHLHNEFLYYFLKSAKQLAEEHASGTTFRELSLTAFSQLPIDVPPLPEQHRIVAKIEELFSELDKGVEALKTAQQQLKIYRQAVLQRAFEGKLTEEWRRQQKDLPTASELLEQIKAERENQAKVTGKKVRPVAPLADAELVELPLLPTGWCWVKLKNLSDKITDGEHFRPKTQQTGVYFLSAKDVRYEGVSFDDPLYISEETAEKALQRCNPEKGDILIVSRGATVGRTCVVNTDRTFCLLGSVILIKVGDSWNSLYIANILKSPSVNQKMVALSGATAQQAIYLRDIGGIAIPLCSIEEQTAIAQEIESRLSVADKIEESINQSLKQAEALRQSILKRAFSGKLVPQDPNDEPAEKLLARIKAERSTQTPVKGPVKKRGAGRKTAGYLIDEHIS